MSVPANSNTLPHKALCFTQPIHFFIQTITRCTCTRVLVRIRGALSQWVSRSVPTYRALVPAAEHFKGTIEFLWDETKQEDALLEGT